MLPLGYFLISDFLKGPVLYQLSGLYVLVLRGKLFRSLENSTLKVKSRLFIYSTFKKKQKKKQSAGQYKQALKYH